MNISIIVPTYRRSQDLRRCLESLKAQTHSPQEVLVVVRDSDLETKTFFEDYNSQHLNLRRITVCVPGVVAAMNAGLVEAQNEIIALTDDDTAPHPDWLARILAHFAADDRVGGVGGRDWQPSERGSAAVVGKVQWYGRVIGNHHLGVGGAREVDIIKGANCAYRAEPLRQISFDTRLLGSGAQVHWELSLGLAMKRAGWKLIYDPAVAINHFPAERFDEDQILRGVFNKDALHNAIYNETLILLQHLPLFRRTIFLAWAGLIGTRANPGLFHIPRLIILRDSHVRDRVFATISGRSTAIRAYIQSRIRTNSFPTWVSGF